MSITWICHSKRFFNTSPPHLFWYLCWFSLHQRFLLYTTTLYVYHSVKLGGKEDQKKKKKKSKTSSSMQCIIPCVLLSDRLFYTLLWPSSAPQKSIHIHICIRCLSLFWKRIKGKRESPSQRALPLSPRVGIILAIISSLVIKWSMRSRWFNRLFMSLLHSFSTSSASRGLEKLINRAGRSILA